MNSKLIFICLLAVCILIAHLELQAAPAEPLLPANTNNAQLEPSPDFKIPELDYLEIFELILTEGQATKILAGVREQNSLEGALNHLSLNQSDKLIFQAIESERLKHQIFYERTRKLLSKASVQQIKELELPSLDLLDEYKAQINSFFDALTTRLNMRFIQEDIRFAVMDYPEREGAILAWYFKNLNTMVRAGMFATLANLYHSAEISLFHKHRRFYLGSDVLSEDYNYWVNKQQIVAHELTDAALYYMDQLVEKYPEIWKEVREHRDLHPKLQQRYEHLNAVQEPGPRCDEVFLQLTMPPHIVSVLTKPTR